MSIFVYFIEQLKVIKFCSVLLLLLFVLYHNPFTNKQFRKLNIVLFMFSSVVLLSGFISEIEFGEARWHISVMSSILLACQTIACFGFAEFIILEKKQKEFLYDFTLILSACLIIADFYILLIFPSIVEEPITTYFVGNKFIVSYYHLLLFALCGTLFNLSKWVEILLFLLCLLVSKVVYCSTGIIGTVAFFVFYIGKKYLKNRLYKPTLLIISVIMSSLFAIFVNIILSLPLFQSILVALGESPSLTGRTVIYANIIDIILKRPLLGYGNANNSSYVLYYTRIGNAQNGLLADIVDWGFIGTLLFLILTTIVIKMCKNREAGYYMLCYIYMYIVTAMVEITMGGKFIVALSILLVASNVGMKIVLDKRFLIGDILPRKDDEESWLLFKKKRHE